MRYLASVQDHVVNDDSEFKKMLEEIRKKEKEEEDMWFYADDQTDEE